VLFRSGLEQIREKNYGQASIFYGSPTLNIAQNG
jgi:16S rRNA (guanine966-N2)-methyltransferase